MVIKVNKKYGLNPQQNYVEGRAVLLSPLFSKDEYLWMKQTWRQKGMKGAK